MTLLRLYAENGNRAGFWVQHRRWANVCAQVQRIAGRSEGALPISVANGDVVMRLFDVRSGRPVNPAPEVGEGEDRNYKSIAAPFWSHGIEGERAGPQLAAES